MSRQIIAVLTLLFIVCLFVLLLNTPRVKGRIEMALDWDIRQISKLIKKAQSGDEDAIVEVLDHYEYQINNIADFFMNNYDIGVLDKDDLMQAGRIGIINCLNKPTEVRFASKINKYIWQSIQREIYNNCRTIRFPVYIWEEYNNTKDDPNAPVLDVFRKNETEPLDNYDFAWTDFENERLTDYNYEHLIANLIQVCTPKEQFVLYNSHRKPMNFSSLDECASCPRLNEG